MSTKSPTAKTTASPTKTTTGSCTFETKDLCGWSVPQGGKGKWLRGTTTPSYSTGAAKGYGGKGYFMFLETSSPSKKGDTSYIQHPVRAGYKSMSFRYHMHGATMGALSVEVQVGKSTKWTTIFKEEGQANFKKQSDAFRLAQARLPAPQAATCPPSISTTPVRVNYRYLTGAFPLGVSGTGCYYI